MYFENYTQKRNCNILTKISHTAKYYLWTISKQLGWLVK